MARFGPMCRHSDALAPCVSHGGGLGEAIEAQKHAALANVGRDGGEAVEGRVLRQAWKAGPSETVTPLRGRFEMN